MLPSIACCYQDKSLPFFQPKHIDLADSPHIAKRQQNINGKLVSADQKWACPCVHVWGGLGSRGPERQRICRAAGPMGLCFAQPGVINMSSWLLTAGRRYLESPQMEWFVEASSSCHFSVLTVPELNVSVITTKARKKPLFFKMQTKATLGYMDNNVWIS